ncbi:(d)CMP kinase [Halosquirtibacter xylanolyticus]|uniref:(d)CMP kinase n=1 Tax=Halosquirtibacter xylanolyticus TaxID=3374599 RepID=UPI003748F68D|nr:(d)CMP kinase [Prolixibacteraceae bacterium]
MKGKQTKLVIAIDGFSSCGKSTMAKDIAKRMSYIYVDTGAMYRAVTLYALRMNWIKEDHVEKQLLIDALNDIHISFQYNEENQTNVTFLNGENIETEIRQLGVSNNVSVIAAIAEVRHHLVKLQQEFGNDGGVVMDGRDIGTVVFPHADLKVFMTADPLIRAKRRFDELNAKGDHVTLDEILANVEKRDYIDQNRDESPLTKADDAVVLDNSHITPSEQTALVMEWIQEKIEEKDL